MPDRGRNGGIKVVFDKPGLPTTDPGYNAKFQGEAYGFDFNFSVNAENDAGRGDGFVEPEIPLSAGGGLVIYAKCRRDAWASPPNFQGELITDALLYFDWREADATPPSAYVRLPKVRVLGQKIASNVKGTENGTIWGITLTCRIEEQPVWVGFGYDENGVQTTQPTNAAQSYPPKELWAETWKLFDPQGLITAAKTRIRLFAIGDSTEAEATALAGTIADAVIPMTGLKRHDGRIVRRSAKVCVVDVAWSLKDTKDEVVLPLRVKNTTVGGTANSATSADINSQPGNPGVFNTVYNGQIIRILNDGKTLFENRYDKWDDIQAYELGGSFLVRDPSTSHINDAAKDVKVFTTSDGPPTNRPVPTGLKVVSQVPQNINNSQSIYTTGFGKQNSLDLIRDPKQNTGVDPKKIGNDAVRTKEWFSDQIPPDDPDDPPSNDVKQRAYTDLVVYPENSTAPGLNLRVFFYGKQDSLDQIRNPKQRTNVDANGITDDSVRTKEWLTGTTPPTVPDDPPVNNVKLITYTDLTIYPVIGITSGLMLRVFLYGARDSKDEQILANYETTTDASALTSNAIRAYLDGDSVPSTPSGLVLRDTKVRPLTLSLGTNRTLTVLVFGVRTHEQDITFPDTRVVTETTNLVKNPTVTVVTSSATPDFNALNPDATNLSLWWGVSHQETNSGKWVNAAEFRPLAPDQEMTAQFEVDDIDPALIQDGSVRVLYNTTSTPDSAPSVSGKVHFRTTVKRVGKVKYRYVYEYRYRTSVQQMAAEKYRVATDVSGIDSRAVTAEVYLVASPPATPTYSTFSLDSSFVLTDKDDVETPNPLYRLRVYLWALLTNLEKRTFPKNSVADDPFGLFHEDIFTLESSTTGTTNGAFATTQRNLYVGSKEYGGVAVQQFNQNLKALRRRLINDSKTVRGKIRSGRSPSYLGNIGSIIQVATAIPNGPSQTEIVLSPIAYWRSVGLIYVTRRFTVTTDITETIVQTAKMNRVNNGALLGINAGFLMYTGVQFTYVGGLPSARPTGVVYELAFDILRFQSNVDTRPTYYGNAGITPGQQNITGLGIGVGVTFPLSDDLSFIWA